MGKPASPPRANRVIESAIEEARLLNHDYVGTEHLLLGLLRVEEGIAFEVLTGLDLELETVREEVIRRLSEGQAGGDEPERAASRGKSTRTATPVLDSFSRDLTDLARHGKLDPVIGRDDVYARLFPLLATGGRIFPVLVGEPGVGKTAIVAGLRRRSSTTRSLSSSALTASSRSTCASCSPGPNTAASSRSA